MKLAPYLLACRNAWRSFLYGDVIDRGPLTASPNGFAAIGDIELEGISQRSFLHDRRDQNSFETSHGYTILKAKDGIYEIRKRGENHILGP